MARTLASIDVGDSPDLKRLVDEVRASEGPVVLRQNGEEVAVVLPANHDRNGESRPRLLEAERRAFLATAGGWKGLIDVDEFHANNRESKHVSARPPVHLQRPTLSPATGSPTISPGGLRPSGCSARSSRMASRSAS